MLRRLSLFGGSRGRGRVHLQRLNMLRIGTLHHVQQTFSLAAVTIPFLIIQLIQKACCGGGIVIHVTSCDSFHMILLTPGT